MKSDTNRIMKILVIFIPLVIQISFVPCFAVRVYTKEDILKLREEVREMFQHAYDSYLRYAYPYDELRPLSCDGVDTWGSYSLTLIDALDTLAIMGNYTEFNRVVNIVLQKKNFDADINVSVFETNIRIIGGLLSAHLLSYKTGIELEPGYPCNGPLLRLAEDVAQRLIAAFDTTTGMPYGTINLRLGVPPGETSITCTAGVGTFIVEFGTLSRLTGDPLYEEIALNALKALYHHRSPIGLVGNHIDVMSGRWTAQDAGIGGGVDSYYEYLVKGAILLERPELMSMWREARAAVERHLQKDDWFVWATMLRGHVTLPVFQSLEAYWPGLLALVGSTETALRIMHNYWGVWRQYGFPPEVYSLSAGAAAAAREAYPLRPEHVESLSVLYAATRDPALLVAAEDALRSLQHSARTPCGYATIKDVRDHRKEDRMESFFLAETTKYLYLIFDPDNFIHNPGVGGTRLGAQGECIVGVGGYVFNTEAHPIDPAMLHCCHAERKGINISEVHRVYQLLEEEDNIKFMNLIDESMKTETNATKNTVDNQKESEIVVEAVQMTNNSDEETSPEKTLIQTKTDTGYVNIDGTERERNVKEPLSKEAREKIAFYYNITTSKLELKSENTTPDTKPQEKVEVDDIIVPQTADDVELTTPSETKAKDVFRILPKVIQDFLNNDWKTRPKCEPQRMLEKIRQDKMYPQHPDMERYELLLTPAPSFLQRLTLAGEFTSRKQVEL